MKKRYVIITVVTSVLLGLLCIIMSVLIICPMFVLLIGIQLQPNPPSPTVTYGEFPFELVYEIDGEVVAVKDTYVCEFDGFGANTGVGKYRKWNGYIKGTGETSILICEDDISLIYCSVGDAEYYMDDERYPTQLPLTPRIYDVLKDSEDTENIFRFENSWYVKQSCAILIYAILLPCTL